MLMPWIHEKQLMVPPDTYPSPESLALVADVQYHEPYLSAALNRKFRGIVDPGFCAGFLPKPWRWDEPVNHPQWMVIKPLARRRWILVNSTR